MCDITRHNPHGNPHVVTNSARAGGGIELEKSIYTQISWHSKRLGKKMHKNSPWQLNEVLVTCCSFPTVFECDLGS